MVSRTLEHALVGAAVSLVLSFVPLSPALGGGVAGYLGRGDVTDGAKVGALSGALAAIPGTLFVVGVVSFLAIAPPDGGGLAFFALVVAAAFLAVGLYGIALGAVGGAVGAYLADEYGGGRRTVPPADDPRPRNEWANDEEANDPRSSADRDDRSGRDDE